MKHLILAFAPHYAKLTLWQQRESADALVSSLPDVCMLADGIPQEDIDEAFAHGTKFFNLPEDVKAKSQVWSVPMSATPFGL